LLTDREREIISGEAEVENTYKNQAIHQIRQKIKQLEDDLAFIDEHSVSLSGEVKRTVYGQKRKRNQERNADNEDYSDQVDADEWAMQSRC